MSGQALVAGAVQAGGLIAAPLAPGLAQWTKARLQGRRGATPLQPYRDLARLWRKSRVEPEGTGPAYRLAPALAATGVALGALLVPVAGAAPAWPVGHDMLALLGLLAVGRLALAIASFDTANGFALQGASRDLALSVAVEAALVLALACAALAGPTTDLRGIAAATAGWRPWGDPAQVLGLVAFAVAAVAETGRQPVDNPDTHLELTMIHEGPLLEYAGRDLAYLQWAAAARHWLVLVLAAQVFLPHLHGVWPQLAVLPVALVVLCAALAIVETLIVKMRILLVPRLLAVGAAAALLGIAAWIAGLA
jgi:formate hydrogenlyase subunit 4